MEENSHRKPQLTLPNQALEPIHNEGLYEIVKKKIFNPIVEFYNSRAFGNGCIIFFFASFMIGLFLFMYYYN